MSFTVLVSADSKLATKQHIRHESGKTDTLNYNRGYWWRVEKMPFFGFDHMATVLMLLLDAPYALVIRAEPKPGLDLTKPIRRKYLGPDATFDDVPRQWLHGDIDGVAAEHLDVIADPDGAMHHVLDVIAEHAPELDGVSAFCAFSSSAGVNDVTRAKLHVWWWLDRPYTNTELKQWGWQVNERAGYKLFDTAVFNAVQPNYTARPLFIGRTDPFAGARRYAVARGRIDFAKLVIGTETPGQRRTASGSRAISNATEQPNYTARPIFTDRAVPLSPAGGGRAFFWGGGFDRHLADIGGMRGLYEPARAAVAARVAALGAERAAQERDSILARVTDALREAPRGNRSRERVEEYCHDIVRLLDWVIDRQRESEAARPKEPSANTSRRLPVGEARQRLAMMTHDTIAALLSTNWQP